VLEGQPVEDDPTRTDTQPAFGCYLAKPDAGGAHFTWIVVPRRARRQLAGATRFLDPEFGKPFGMPDVLDPQASG
jgi:hypothetical protein